MQFLYLFPVLLLLLLSACGSEEKSALNQDMTHREQLLNESIYLEIPDTYRRTDQGRYAQDMTNLILDEAGKARIENLLSSLEFEDRDIDFFYDTVTRFNCLILVNVAQLPLNKTTATMMSAQVKKQYEAMTMVDPLITAEKVTSSINRGNGKTIAQYKYRIDNERNQQSFYSSLYLVSDQGFGLVGYELSVYEESLYPILWSVHTR